MFSAYAFMYCTGENKLGEAKLSMSVFLSPRISNVAYYDESVVNIIS